MSGLNRIRTHILVCKHKDCVSRGGQESLRELKGALGEACERGEVLVTKVKCLDQCESGPVMVVYPEGVWYGGVDGRGAREIAERHGACAGSGGPPRCRVLRDMRGELLGVEGAAEELG